APASPPELTTGAGDVRDARLHAHARGHPRDHDLAPQEGRGPERRHHHRRRPHPPFRLRDGRADRAQLPMAAALWVRGQASAAAVPLHRFRLRRVLGADPRRVRPLAEPPRRLLGATGAGERRGALHLRRDPAVGWADRAVRTRGLAPPPRTSTPTEATLMEAAQVSLL